jgi:hypothetical protein
MCAKKREYELFSLTLPREVNVTIHKYVSSGHSLSDAPCPTLSPPRSVTVLHLLITHPTHPL